MLSFIEILLSLITLFLGIIAFNSLGLRFPTIYAIKIRIHMYLAKCEWFRNMTQYRSLKKEYEEMEEKQKENPNAYMAIRFNNADIIRKLSEYSMEQKERLDYYMPYLNKFEYCLVGIEY